MSQPEQAAAAASSPPLCSTLHELRTAENSGGYFQPKLQSLKAANPDGLKLLDVGSGWGHMSASLAQVLGRSQDRVIGLDINPDSLSHARQVIATKFPQNSVEFIHGDAYELPFPDGEFHVTHAHQVLAHLERPWDVVREMVRVTKPGGIVAIREGDLESEVVWPPEEGLLKFHKLIVTAMKTRGKGGGGADAGRQLLPWALKTGLRRDQITLSYGTWWFDTPENKDKWGRLCSFSLLHFPSYLSSYAHVLTLANHSQSHDRPGERRRGGRDSQENGARD